MNSIRLPGKMLKKIGKKLALECMTDRLRYSRKLDEIILAIGKENSQLLVNLAKKNKLRYFVGSEEDVLDRFYQTAKKFHADIILRTTSDAPLIDPEIIDNVINFYLQREDKIDFVTTTKPKDTFPEGMGTEIFSFSTLKRTWREAKQDYERQHVTPYMFKHPEIFHINTFSNKEDLSHMRWTIDEEQDLQFIREIYKRISKIDKFCHMQDILEILRKEPYLLKINQDVQQKIVKI